MASINVWLTIRKVKIRHGMEIHEKYFSVWISQFYKDMNSSRFSGIVGTGNRSLVI